MAKKNRSIGMVSPDDAWRVEDDMQTLMRADEIRADPKRMAKIKTLAKQKLETMAGVIAKANDTE